MIKPESGETVGRYRVKEFLARGGFSLVYLAEGPEGDVALKIGDVGGGGIMSPDSRMSRVSARPMESVLMRLQLRHFFPEGWSANRLYGC